MSAFSKLQDKVLPHHTVIAVTAIIAGWSFYRRIAKTKEKRNGEKIQVIVSESQIKKEKAAVDIKFFRQMKRLLRILVPSWCSVEVWYILLVTGSLALRTYADVWMIENGTLIESSIIGRDSNLFRRYLLRFLWAMPSISLVNNLLKYGLNELKLRFRNRLSMHLYGKYLRHFTYYKMSNLDNRIANADQLLTQDVEKFCDSVGDLYSNLSKPLLDIVIYTAKLTNAIGIQGPSWMLLYLAVSGLFLTRLRRPTGKLTMNEQKLEGQYRYVNSRLITNSEEVAFYQGNAKEKGVIVSTFKNLINHLHDFIYFRFNMGMIDNIIAKYFATVVGYLVVSRPFLDLTSPKFLNSPHSHLLEEYYKSGRMLVMMAQAIGRVVLAGRDMARLAGFTTRITQFITVLDDLNSGKYERSMVNSKNERRKSMVPLEQKKQDELVPGSGKIVYKDRIIRFEKVPLVTPNGDVLVNELNFEVPSGRNVLVCGPNGCGKSSLFRILGELWPLFGGTVIKPPAKELFYIPQRPYMTLGTLRDQVIYPDSKDDMNRKGIKDSDLMEIITKVQLSFLIEREGGWNSVADWMDVLSGGEKQRIAMSRLFYHKPQFAILDECTSAVSVDVEGYMYNHCREVGITLFTVSHRKSLWKHHEYYLQMDGRGSFEFEKITDNTQEFGS